MIFITFIFLFLIFAAGVVLFVLGWKDDITQSVVFGAVLIIVGMAAFNAAFWWDWSGPNGPVYNPPITWSATVWLTGLFVLLELIFYFLIISGDRCGENIWLHVLYKKLQALGLTVLIFLVFPVGYYVYDTIATQGKTFLFIFGIVGALGLYYLVNVVLTLILEAFNAAVASPKPETIEAMKEVKRRTKRRRIKR